ncbi:MAG: efflux RND transporter permease subunit, partial [Betaproteobacteria bacterium]
MNISAWCIKNPIPAIMLFVMLSFAGVISYQFMKVQYFPDLDLPTVIVTASLPGASPAQLETEVARKIENSLASLQGLKHIFTNIQDDVVAITVEFRLEKSVQEAVDDVRSAVSQVRADLPTDLRDPEVSKLNVAGAPMLSYTISAANMDVEALSWFVDNELTKKLLGVKGLGKVSRVGGVNRQITVALNPTELQALNATAADISHQLRLSQMEAAAGHTKLGGSEQAMRTIATVSSAEAIGDISLSLSDGRKITLNQVAKVRDGFAEPRSAALLDGKPVVGFEISRSKGASEIEVGDGVQKIFAELKLKHPEIVLTEAFNFVQPVKDEYTASLTMLIEGALLAVLVVLLFLRNLRATFICAVALPLSVIPAFIGMANFGFSINVVTLLALSLVIGILVDDAIVEVENIVRHLRMGKTPYQAAMEATDEIGLAVIATTFTLIAVFLPTAFMTGIPGKFFKQFGWTASFAIFASLAVARVLTPMMSAYLLKPNNTQTKDGLIMRGYLR